MKKSFFSTFIVFIFVSFSLFFTVFNIVEARTEVKRETGYDSVNGVNFIRITYDDGYWAYIKDGVINTADLYDNNGKKVETDRSAFLGDVTNSIKSAGWYDDAGLGTKEFIKGAVDSVLSDIGKVFTSLLSAAGVAILALANLILGLAGQFFDMIIKTTVTTQDLFDSIKEPINVAWKILRDVANIAIVFSLLYLAIRTILNGNGFADTKTLAGVLVAAVLINFSLFFVTLAFNTSNFIAKSIADQIVISDGRDSSGNASQSISANVARMVGTKDAINKLWNQSFGLAGSNAANNEWDVAFNDLRSGALTAVTMMVLVIIFCVASVLMLYRFFVFTLLMITSPFGLISAFIPWFRGMSKQWWDQLKHQFIYLPAFLLTLYIALLFIGTITSGLQPTTDTITYLYYFFLTCGFLLMVLIVPSKIAGTGGAFVSGVTNWGTSKLRSMPKRSLQFGGRVAASGSARSMQYGARLAGGKILNSEKLKTMAQDENSRSGKFARVLMRNADGLKNKTYDVRNTGVGKKLGLGAGIQNWNDTVAAKAKALEERKEKEKKLFGYDDAAKTEENKNAIVAAEAVRDAQGAIAKKAGEDVKAAQIEYTKAMATGTATEQADAKKNMEEARAKFETQSKRLEDEERKVGELRNKGDSDYLKLVQARNKRIWNKMSLTQRAAVEKMEKDMKEKWLKDGKYKAPKEKKNKTTAPSATPPPLPTRPTVSFGNGGGMNTSSTGGTSTGTVSFGNSGRSSGGPGIGNNGMRNANPSRRGIGGSGTQGLGNSGQGGGLPPPSNP